MASKLTLSALVAVLALSVSGTADADGMDDVRARRLVNPPLASVPACPMDDQEFWAHWATQRGYEHMLRGDMKEAANCYDKAAQMRGMPSREGVAVPHPYSRVAAILRELPRGAINLQRETFEESAERALKRGDNRLASTLYELTALGWSHIGMQGRHGRFRHDTVIHKVSGLWQDGYITVGYFFEVAAELASNPDEKRRLLEDAKYFTALILDTGFCSNSDYRVRQGEQPKYCQQAKETVARLGRILENR